MNEQPIKDVSMAASISTGAIDMNRSWQWAVQFVWTGTPTGTVKVQASCNGIDFADVTSASVATGGAAGNFLFNAAVPVGYNYLQLVYTFASGTGTLNAWVNGKETNL